MSLLCVIVKEAHINGPDSNFNTYVVLKIGSVKSTTTAIQGVQPSWQEEFCFEINEFDLGLTIELWNRGMLWDKLLGLHWLPLIQINHSSSDKQSENDIRISLDSELCLKDGKIIGTQHPTGNSLLINARIDVSPSELNEAESLEMQKKLDLLNEILEQEGLCLENDLESLLILKDLQNKNSNMQSGMEECEIVGVDSLTIEENKIKELNNQSKSNNNMQQQQQQQHQQNEEEFNNSYEAYSGSYGGGLNETNLNDQNEIKRQQRMSQCFSDDSDYTSDNAAAKSSGSANSALNTNNRFMNNINNANNNNINQQQQPTHKRQLPPPPLIASSSSSTAHHHQHHQARKHSQTLPNQSTYQSKLDSIEQQQELYQSQQQIPQQQQQPPQRFHSASNQTRFMNISDDEYETNKNLFNKNNTTPDKTSKPFMQQQQQQPATTSLNTTTTTKPQFSLVRPAKKKPVIDTNLENSYLSSNLYSSSSPQHNSGLNQAQSNIITDNNNIGYLNESANYFQPTNQTNKTKQQQQQQRKASGTSINPYMSGSPSENEFLNSAATTRRHSKHNTKPTKTLNEQQQANDYYSSNDYNVDLSYNSRPSSQTNKNLSYDYTNQQHQNRVSVIESPTSSSNKFITNVLPKQTKSKYYQDDQDDQYNNEDLYYMNESAGNNYSNRKTSVVGGGGGGGASGVAPLSSSLYTNDQIDYENINKDQHHHHQYMNNRSIAVKRWQDAINQVIRQVSRVSFSFLFFIFVTINGLIC